ncbi:MAG: hypothetical protein WBZ40_11115 [Acidimicrobiia bacterium]
MSRLERGGIAVDLPEGWEGSISGGGFELLSDGAVQPTVLHAGSFPLPAERGTYGSGAVETMGPMDAFISLVEFGPESAGTPLFAAGGLPRNLNQRQFDRNMLQRALPGQTGCQLFFSQSGRPFCLYVVLGSHIDRADILPMVNTVLDRLDLT